MPEYIERERLIDAIEGINWYKYNDEGRLTQGGTFHDKMFLPYSAVDGTIKSIPAADVVEVRHGKWVLFDNTFSSWNVWVCSECGYRRKEGWMHTEAGKKPNAQYCEHCMAKMDGGVNDDDN